MAIEVNNLLKFDQFDLVAEDVKTLVIKKTYQLKKIKMFKKPCKSRKYFFTKILYSNLNNKSKVNF